MSYANGRLPNSALARIPGGRLRVDAARSYMAMREFIHRKEGIWIAPTSSRTAYRTFAEQVYFKNLQLYHGGALAAEPGYSNHGWGIAIDFPTYEMQAAVRKWGHLFGWGIRDGRLSSDAPSEDWHATFHPGVYHPPPPNLFPTISKGDRGVAVRRLQVYLRGARYLPSKWHVHHVYSLYVRRAVRRFQKDHHMKVDGVVGPATWKVLRKSQRR